MSVQFLRILVVGFCLPLLSLAAPNQKKANENGSGIGELSPSSVSSEKDTASTSAHWPNVLHVGDSGFPRQSGMRYGSQRTSSQTIPTNTGANPPLIPSLGSNQACAPGYSNSSMQTVTSVFTETQTVTTVITSMETTTAMATKTLTVYVTTTVTSVGYQASGAQGQTSAAGGSAPYPITGAQPIGSAPYGTGNPFGPLPTIAGSGHPAGSSFSYGSGQSPAITTAAVQLFGSKTYPSSFYQPPPGAASGSGAPFTPLHASSDRLGYGGNVSTSNYYLSGISRYSNQLPLPTSSSVVPSNTYPISSYAQPNNPPYPISSQAPPQPIGTGVPPQNLTTGTSSTCTSSTCTSSTCTSPSTTTMSAFVSLALPQFALA